MVATDSTTTSDGTAGEGEPPVAGRRRWAAPRRLLSGGRGRDGLVLAGYVCATVVIFHPVLRHPRWYVLGTNMGDDTRHVWAWAWVPHAISNHLNPFLSTLQFARVGGTNLTANTSLLFPALVMAPVTAVVGPLASINLAMVLSPLVAAAGAYAVLRRWSTRVGAALGGWTYGFSTYMLVKQLGHANLVAIVPLLPLLALAVMARCDSRRRQLWLGAVIGMLLAALVYTSVEIAATAVVYAICLLGTAAVVGLVRGWRPWFDQRRVLLGVAAAVAVVLSLPFVGYYLLGPEVPYSMVQPSEMYDMDVAELVVPTDLQVLSPPRNQSRANNALDQAHIDSGQVPAYDFPWSGSDHEWAGFIGLPLLALIVWALVRWRASTVVERGAALGAVVGIVLAAGATLHVNGRDTGVLLPWALFNRMPLLHTALSSRNIQFAFGALAVLVALQFPRSAGRATEAPAGEGPRVRRALAAAGVLMLLPAVPFPHHRVPTYAGIDGLAARPGCHGDGSAVVFLPPDRGRDELGAQVAADLSFRLARGSAYRTSPYPDLVLDRLFRADPPPPEAVDRRSAASELDRLGATCIVLFPGDEPVAAAVTVIDRLAGQPAVRSGDLLIWSRPAAGWRST